MRLLVLLLLLTGGYANAHQFTPTYPKLEISHMPGIMKADMVLFNDRSEINYYGINVFDEKWNPVRFATQTKIVPINYKERKYITIYLSGTGIKNAKYICSKSKILMTVTKPSIVSSRICSKIK
jgi:hypothetical protein